MDFNFQLNNFSFMFFIVSLSFLTFIILYFNNLKKYPFYLKSIILTSRTIVLIFLLIFLIDPIIFFKDLNVTNPKINVFLDNSLSMRNNFENINVRIKDILSKIKIWSLENNVSINYYKFGDDFIQIEDLDELNFSDNVTNYST